MASTLFSDIYGRPERHAVSVEKHNEVLREQERRDATGVDSAYSVRMSLVMETVTTAAHMLEAGDLSEADRKAWQRIYVEQKRILDAMPRATTEVGRKRLEMTWRTT